MKQASHEPTIVLEIEDCIATITMNRPDRRNGMNIDMVRDMHATLQALAIRRDVSVVILTGAGGHFCVGADIGDSKPEPNVINHKTLAPYYHATTLLHEMPQITIAAIDGGCAGAGLAWAAACDLRFASDRARFSTAFLNVGVAGDMGAAWVIQRAVGPSRARELFFFPDKFGADVALRYELVTRVFPAAVLRSETHARAANLASKPPYTLQMIKANFVAADRLSLSDFVELEGARHLHVMGRPETHDAFAAFSGKSGPRN